jgi:hypothetical protein
MEAYLDKDEPIVLIEEDDDHFDSKPGYMLDDL